MPKLERILETVLYVKDLERAAAFYEEFMELPVLFTDQRMRAFDVGGNGTLLLFITGQSLRPVETPMGTIPPHDGGRPGPYRFLDHENRTRSLGEASRQGRHFPSRAGWNGRAAASASISVIRTII